MFSWMRQPKLDLKIKLSNAGRLHAGDTIDVQMIFSPQERVHVRTGKIELVCTSTYGESEEVVVKILWGTPGKPGWSRKTVERLFCQTRSFLDDAELPPGVEYTEQVGFSLPDDAAPTTQGAPDRQLRNMEGGIVWRLNISLDVARHMDPRWEYGLTVLGRAEK